MAEYVFPNLPTEPLKVGDKVRFNYTGTSQQINRPEVSRYYIEVYGASGGGRVETNNPGYGFGGKGAKAEGELNTNSQPLIIFVGGVGKLGTGGFNGGGSTDGMYGGGATDVRHGGSQLENRVIVAAGGGGAAYNGNGTINGGYGGSTSGGTGSNSGSSMGGGGGTQTSGGTGGSGFTPGKNGALGLGGHGSNSAGGGGGGYYGGGGGGSDRNLVTSAGGGGGSSYIGGVSKGKMSFSENTGDGYAILTVMTPPNNPPTLILTSPADNQTLAEGNSYPVEGTASDADSGNVVTVKYQINNGPVRALQSGVSDGNTPISFARGLTYRNKRIWDGVTDVIGEDLVEDEEHILRVWAEDDQGGKSAEVIRKFRVVWNRPPEISGVNGDLGILEMAPVVTYSVSDPEGNAFTVVEKINGVELRSYPGEPGREERFEIPLDTWLRLEPGVLHTISLEATDSDGGKSTRTYTFTRFEDEISFEIEVPWTTDAAAKRILLTLDMSFPPGAILLVEATNNAFDESPVWEDISFNARYGRGYVFHNDQKTADKWGVSVRVRIEKGTATEPIEIKGFGGAFD